MKPTTIAFIAVAVSLFLHISGMTALHQEPQAIPPKPVKIKVNYVQKEPQKVKKEGKGHAKKPTSVTKPDNRKILPPPAPKVNKQKDAPNLSKPAVNKQKDALYFEKIKALNKFSDERYANKKKRRKEYAGKTSDCYSAYIGFGFYWDSTDQRRGYITGVAPGYPAYFAGLKAGDYVTFPRAIYRNATLGESFSVTVQRGKYTFREGMVAKAICI